MEKLTDKEIEILKLVTDGYGNCEIGKMVYLSTHTVKAHISAIIRKLEAKNRTNAVKIAIVNNLIDL